MAELMYNPAEMTVKDIRDFEAWDGGEDTLELIINNNKEGEFIGLLMELYTHPVSETDLNDLLRFEDDWLIRVLRLEAEDE